MAVEMSADLFFGLRDETEAPAITKHAAGGAYRERACIPERTESARLGAEFGKPLFAPGEVIEFFVCRALHLGFEAGIAGNCGVTLIKPLRGHFTGMVNPHQSGSVTFLRVIEITFGDICGGVGACGRPGGSGNGAQRVVGACEQPIERRQGAILHTRGL